MDRILAKRVLLASFIVVIGLLTSCSFESTTGYIKTFEKISFHSRRSYGMGGIYWVSKDHIVLSAYIDTSKKKEDHAIYQVNVNDGTHVKVIEIADNQPITYRYCFDGDTLFVSWSRGSFEVLEVSVDYKIKVKEFEKKNKTNIYSPLRCRFYERPTNEFGFSALRAEDGFIKYGKKEENGDNYTQVFLADNNGKTLKHLMDKKLHPYKKIDLDGHYSIRRFAAHQNIYFGQSGFKDNSRSAYKMKLSDIDFCTQLNFLYRGKWEAKQKDLCLNNWSFASKVVLLLDNGLFIETHETKSGYPNAYVIHNGKGGVIDEGIIRDSSVSQDGCKVAYGSIDKWGRGKPYTLRVLNYCDYRHELVTNVLGKPLVEGGEGSNKKRKTYSKEAPFYFVD